MDVPSKHIGNSNFSQTTAHFDTNPLSGRHNYQLTFDIAVTDYYRPANATEHGCYVQPAWTVEPNYFTGLELKNYGPNFTTVGPWTLDFENTGGQIQIAISTICEQPNPKLHYAEHGTVLFDNFVWSQYDAPVVFT